MALLTFMSFCPEPVIAALYEQRDSVDIIVVDYMSGQCTVTVVLRRKQRSEARNIVMTSSGRCEILW